MKVNKMILPEKNLYINGNFDYFSDKEVVIDNKKSLIFIPDTNISSQLKRSPFLMNIYYSDIVRLSDNIEDLKENLHSNSYLDLIFMLLSFVSNNKEDHLKSICNFKNYCSNFTINLNQTVINKYQQNPIQCFIDIQYQMLEVQKEYIKELTLLLGKNSRENFFLEDILSSHSDITFIQTNLGSNLESYISKSGIKGNVSESKIHALNHFTLSFINSIILETIFQEKNIKTLPLNNDFYILFRLYEVSIIKLFDRIKEEINYIFDIISVSKEKSYRKNIDIITNIIKEKNLHIITLLILEYNINYNIITQNYKKEIIPKQLEGFGSIGITDDYFYQNTILDLLLLFVSMSFFKKNNFDTYFMTNDQGYIYLSVLYKCTLSTENKHIININHKKTPDNFIKLIDKEEYEVINQELRDEIINLLNT